MMAPIQVDVAGALWPVTALVSVLIVNGLIRKGLLKGFTFEKGKLSISTQQADQRDTVRYHRNRRIIKIDAELDDAARDITAAQSRPLKRALKSDRLCSPAIVAIASGLLGQLYSAVNKNDFKHGLAKDNREGYIREKIDNIMKEYEEFLEDNRESPCSDLNTPTIYPHWYEIQPVVELTVRDWAGKIIDAVIRACEEKISVYKEYMPTVEANHDEHDMDVLVECIMKNKGYIDGLGRVDS